MILNIHDYIDSSLAVSADQGQKVFEKITDTVDCKINPNAVRTKKISFL